MIFSSFDQLLINFWTNTFFSWCSFMKSNLTALLTENVKEDSSSCWQELQICERLFRVSRDLLKDQRSLNSDHINEQWSTYSHFKCVHSLLALQMTPSQQFSKKKYQSYQSIILIFLWQTKRITLWLTLFLRMKWSYMTLNSEKFTN